MTGHFLRFYQSAPQTQLLLICLPHAGGGASTYRPWGSLFDARIAVAAVQYPGHEDRFTENTIDNMSQLLSALCDELLPQVARQPYVLLGHSMGGAVAHELALRLSEQGYPPQRLIISGRQPPCFHPHNSKIHCGGDDDILAELRRLSPANQALLSTPELATLLLPIIRSDYRLIENYCPAPAPRVACPIDVLAGRDDPELPLVQANAWAEYTSAACQVHLYPGDHFFIASQRSAVVGTLQRLLQSCLTPVS